MENTVLNDKISAAVDAFLSKVSKDKNVTAVFTFGSTVNGSNWEKSDVDICIIFRDGTLKDGYISYSACVDSLDFEVIALNSSCFTDRLSDYRTMLFYRNIVNTGSLLYCTDEDIEELFASPAVTDRRETEIALLRSGTYAILAKLKAEKHLIYTKDIRLAADYLSRYLNNLASVEVLVHNEVPGREPELRAAALNPSFFLSMLGTLSGGAITTEVLKGIYTNCGEYLGERATTVFRPIISLLQEEQTEMGIGEISEYIGKKYFVDNSLFQITNACNYLAEKDILVRLSAPKPIYGNSRVFIDEPAYAAR